MRLYQWLDRYLFLPLGDWLIGSQIIEQYKSLLKSDGLKEEELQKLQNEKLQRLIIHCYETVPYYRNLFDKEKINPVGIRTPKDLYKIPLLTKELIREHYNELISCDADLKRCRTNSTGGSTGTPLKYLSDQKAWSIQKASTLRAWGWYGLSLGDKIFSLAGSSLVREKGRFSLGGIYERWVMRNYKFSSGGMKEDTMWRYYKELMRIRPAAIRGYASSLVLFASFIEERELPVPPLKAILTTGEKLMPSYREMLERIFSAPLYDAYGAGDGGIVSHECPKRQGLHISSECCVIEITDSEGHPVEEGETGYVVSTDLENYAFPFLRYKVGDMANIKSERCSCGRASRLFGEVLGRSGKLIFNKQGEAVSPTMLPIMLYRNCDYHNSDHVALYNKIDRFQIRQDKEGNLLILLKMKKGEEPCGEFDYVIDNFRRQFEGSTVSLRFVQDIPCMPSGKEDFCVSEYERKIGENGVI